MGMADIVGMVSTVDVDMDIEEVLGLYSQGRVELLVRDITLYRIFEGG